MYWFLELWCVEVINFRRFIENTLCISNLSAACYQRHIFPLPLQDLSHSGKTCCYISILNFSPLRVKVGNLKVLRNLVDIRLSITQGDLGVITNTIWWYMVYALGIFTHGIGWLLINPTNLFVLDSLRLVISPTLLLSPLFLLSLIPVK